MTTSKHSEINTSSIQIRNIDKEDDTFEISSLKVEDWVSLVLFLSLSLILIAQVLSRYLLNAPIGWTEEIARYQLILLTFLGASINVRKNSHISFVFFHRYVPLNLKSKLIFVLSLTNTLFLLFLLYTSIQITPLIQNHEMSSLSISISSLYVLIGVALFVSLIRSVINSFENFRQTFIKKERK